MDRRSANYLVVDRTFTFLTTSCQMLKMCHLIKVYISSFYRYFSKFGEHIAAQEELRCMLSEIKLWPFLCHLTLAWMLNLHITEEKTTRLVSSKTHVSFWNPANISVPVRSLPRLFCCSCLSPTLEKVNFFLSQPSSVWPTPLLFAANMLVLSSGHDVWHCPRHPRTSSLFLQKCGDIQILEQIKIASSVQEQAEKAFVEY